MNQLLAQSLDLNLHINDLNIIKYLSSFPTDEQEFRALEALRVGIIAIQSASPTLDTRIVEDKFRDVERNIDTCVSTFSEQIRSELKTYFDSKSGSVSGTLDDFFGDKGSIQRLFERYFAGDTGHLPLLLNQHVGPQSSFGRSLDPLNKESVMSRVQEIVENNLEQKVGMIVREFSLDAADSAIVRLKECLTGEIEKIQKMNLAFFAEMRESLGMQAGIEKEAERGTHKGLSFENAVYESLLPHARLADDLPEFVGAVPGLTGKKGDIILTLGDTTVAPGKRIVIEITKERRMKFRDAIDELEEAKKNREAAAGIYAFSKDVAPREIGDFYHNENNFYVTIDEDALEKGESLIFLESAYKIARAMIAVSERKASAEIDQEKLAGAIHDLTALTDRFSELTTKTKTIQSAAKAIDKLIEELEEEIRKKLNSVYRLYIPYD